MRWIRVKRDRSVRPGGAGSRCRQCDRTFKVGEVALVQDTMTNSGIERGIAWHAHCIQKILESITDPAALEVAEDAIPAHSDVIMFNDLRDRIAASGCAFPPEEHCA